MAISREEFEKALNAAGGDVERATQILMETRGTGPSATDRVKGLLNQFDIGVGDFVTGTLEAATQVQQALPFTAPGTEQQIEKLQQIREEAPAPSERGEGTARFLGRVLPEVGTAIAGGAALRGATKVPALLSEILADVAVSTPAASVSPETSSLGGLEALTGRDLGSESPIARVLAEVGLVGASNAALKAASKGLQKLKSQPENIIPPDHADITKEVEQVKGRLAQIHDDLKSAFDTDLKEVLLDEQVRLEKQRDNLLFRQTTRHQLEAEFGSSIVDGPPKKRGVRRILSQFWQNSIDKHVPLTGLVKQGDFSITPETLARNADGSINHATSTIYFGVSKPGESINGEVLHRSKGLHEIAELSGDPQGLSWYLAAMREVENRAVNKGGRLSDKQISLAEALAESNPRIKTAAKAFWKNRHEWLKLLEEEQVIPKGAATRIIKNHNHNYAPSKGINVSSGTPGTRPVVMDDPIFQLKGSRDPIIDPMVAAASQDYYYSRLIHRKRALDALGQLAEANHPLVKKRTSIPVKGSKPHKFEAPDILTKEIDPGLLEEFPSQYGRGFFRIGKQLYETTEPIMKAMQEAPIEDIGAIQQAFRYGGKGLRLGVIYTPVFQIRNFIRDTLFRTVASSTTSNFAPKAVVEVGLQGFSAAAELTMEALRRAGVPLNANQMVHLYESSPGAFTNLSGVTRDTYIHTLRGLSKNINPGYWQNFKTSMSELNEIIHSTTSIIENTNRYAEFKAARKEALDQGMDEAMANELAAFKAAEISVNFRRNGARTQHEIGKTLRLGTAFWNPHVQGLTRTGRLFKDPETAFRTAQAGIAGLFAPAVAIYAMNRSNPDWWGLSDEEKRQHVHINITAIASLLNRPVKQLSAATEEDDMVQEGNTIWWRVPVPHELGMMFATLPINLISQFDPLNPNAEKGVHKFTDEAFEAVTQNIRQLAPITTAGDVGISLLANTDYFSGRNIENPIERTFDTPKQQRGRAGSTRIASAMSDVSQGLVSPAQGDYLIEGMLGPLGGDLSRVVSGAVPSEVEAPAKRLHETAFLRGLFSTGRYGPIKEFYDEYDTLKGRRVQSRSAANEIYPRSEVALSSALNNREDFRYETLNAVSEEIKNLRELIEFTEGDPVLPATEKQRRIERIKDEIERWAIATQWQEEDLPDDMTDEQRAVAKLSRQVRALE